MGGEVRKENETRKTDEEECTGERAKAGGGGVLKYSEGSKDKSKHPYLFQG